MKVGELVQTLDNLAANAGDLSLPNVGHRALLDGLFVYNQLKRLARPRGIEPLFSP